MTRAQIYPQPYLMQTVPLAPNVCLAPLRLNRGYGGATCRVRRASDNTELDCWSQADIVTFCAGTNGFVRTCFDQSGNARNYSEATAANQVKCFDSATGLTKLGSVPAFLGDGANTRLSIPSGVGSASGFNTDQAFTTAMLYRWDGTLVAESGGFQWGFQGLGTNNAVALQVRPDVGTRLVQHYGGTANSYAPPSPGVNTSQWCTFTRANTALSQTTVCVENFNTIPQSVPAVGAVNVTPDAGSYWFVNRNNQTSTFLNPWRGVSALLAGWSGSSNAFQLSGQALASLQQFMDSLRQQL
jgi:hypothetical protein